MTQETQQQAMYQPAPRGIANGFAVTSLVLGIVSIVIGIWSPIPVIGIIPAFIAFVPSALAAVFGHLGLSRAAQHGFGRSAAMTGMILGYVTLAIIVLVTVFWIIAVSANSVNDIFSP